MFDWTILKYQQSQIASAAPRNPVSNIIGCNVFTELPHLCLTDGFLFLKVPGVGTSSGMAPAIATADRHSDTLLKTCNLYDTSHEVLV